ncbi:short-chain collagen C4-like [Dysidea avara]|uniref:short-chain collagen C4-like n=1 Tax=Dysidea avara TaxID=196820 RepID=UPI0033319DAA
MKGDKGEKGSSGLPGSTGLTGPQGAVGQKGTKGDKEDINGGTVYVRWGHDQYPSTAQLVYSGRAGGSWYGNSGSGSNPQCLPLNPTYLKTKIGYETLVSDIFGAEYETSVFGFAKSVHNHDVVCAVCYVSQRFAVYMVPAQYTCPSGWTREYYGYLMAERWNHNRSQYTCIDKALVTVFRTGANNDGLTFYPEEGRCGSLPCPPYDDNKELTCAVCTK